MSQLETNIFDECSGCDMDLLDNTYYKLPFCDEDDLDLKNFSPSDGLWKDSQLDDDMLNSLPYSSCASGFCLSPSSSSSTSSGGNIDHLLLNERPDTPLLAVKFEDFSSAYNLDELSFPNLEDSNSDEPMQEINIDDHINLDMKQESSASSTKVSSHFGSERIVDCSLSPSNAPSPQRPENVFTIPKDEDGNTATKTSLLTCGVKSEKIRFSFNKEQPTIPCLSLSGVTPQQSNPSSSSTQMYLCDQTALLKTTSAQTTATTSCSPSTPVTPLPVHRFKVVPQNKLAGNSFTHKTHIQIPTSTLQTILKNGRLVTRLQQQDGKIRIKTEPCTDNKQFVKISQPQQVDLPPTPPSSASSDGEGSSSPKSTGSRNGDSPCFSASPHIRVQSSGSSLAAQLLSSSQRFAQTHGPLLLTEEEKRTLIAEGYSVPSKLPLTKNEEKSLKKIRRKIKNKLSAQESRRKKKEYVETLERRMDDFNKENMDLKMKLDSLESSNRSLLSQLRSLQTLVAGKIPKPSRSVTTQTSSCLMMLILCFAVFLGGWYPHLSPWGVSHLNAVGYHHSLDVPSTGKIIFSYKEEEYCVHGGCANHQGDLAPDKDDDPDGTGGSDTYDEPAGGGTTMNDTGDQNRKIAANSVDVAETLASRNVVVKNNMEVDVGRKSHHDVRKKVVISASPLVTE